VLIILDIFYVKKALHATTVTAAAHAAATANTMISFYSVSPPLKSSPGLLSVECFF